MISPFLNGGGRGVRREGGVRVEISACGLPSRLAFTPITQLLKNYFDLIVFSCGPQIFLTKGNPWLQAILKSLLNRINLINFFFTKQKARTTCYTCTCYFLFPISFLIIDIILFMRFSRVQSQSRRSLDGTSQRPCPNSLEQ